MKTKDSKVTYSKRELTAKQKRNRKGCIIALISIIALMFLAVGAVFGSLVFMEDFNMITVLGIALACASFVVMLGLSFHLGVTVKNWSKTDEQLLAEKPKVKRRSIALVIVFSVLCLALLALLLITFISEEPWAVALSRSALINISNILLMCGCFVIALFTIVVWGMNASDWKKAKRNIERAALGDNYEETTTNTSRPKKSKSNSQQFPDVAWFESQGMPLKDIPIDKKVLKESLTDDEKYILSVASFALARRKAIIMLIIIGSVLVISGLMARFMGAYAIIIGVFVLLFGGGFVTYKTTKLIEGMELLNANRRIGIPSKWRFLFGMLSLVGGILSFYMTFIYMILQSSRRETMTNMPRVAMPQNYEFDDIIEMYSEYEQSASMSQAWDEHMAHLEQDTYNRQTRELDELKNEVENNSDLSFTQKRELTQKIDDAQSELDEDYDKHTKPRL